MLDLFEMRHADGLKAESLPRLHRMGAHVVCPPVFIFGVFPIHELEIKQGIRVADAIDRIADRRPVLRIVIFFV